VLAHFPLQVGSRWTYETTYYTGDPDKPHADRWSWEVRVTRHAKVTEGLVVAREARVLEGTPRIRGEAAAPWYLVTNGYVYELDATAWDEEAQLVHPDFTRRMRAGELTPAFFFPMRVGLWWAEKEREQADLRDLKERKEAPNGFYHWQVTAQGGAGHCGCMKVPANAFDLLYFTAGGPSEVFFQDGVGVVGMWNRHSGTYWEERTVLKRFIPAAARPAK